MHGQALIHTFMYFVGLREAYSGVTAEELAVLEECARDRELVIELGVYEGRTSRALREVMHQNGDLWLFDPFPAGRLGVNWQYQIAKAEVKRSTKGTVHFERRLSWDAGENWSAPFDFLFIDADHSYEAVARDWKTWSPFAKSGAHIALHDSCCAAPRCRPHDGPVRLVNEIAKTDDRFSLVRQDYSLSVFRRL